MALIPGLTPDEWDLDTINRINDLADCTDELDVLRGCITDLARIAREAVERAGEDMFTMGEI